MPDLPAVAELHIADAFQLDSVEYAGWKLVVDHKKGIEALFDLRRDPDELENVAASHPDRVRALRRALRQTLAAAQHKAKRFGRAPRIDIGKTERDSLRKLGYVE